MTPSVDPQPMSVTSASRGPDQFGRRDRGFDSGNLALALLHHVAALDGVGELVADEHAVFHVLVGGDGVGVARHAGNGARRDAAFGEQIALVAIRAVAVERK